MSKPKGPELTVEIDTEGVTRIVVETDRGQRAQGTALLQRVLPQLDEITRCIKGKHGND